MADADKTKWMTHHRVVARRYFLRRGAAGLAALSALPYLAVAADREPTLQKEVDGLESWLTLPDDFQDVSRGKPKPHSLDDATRKKVGLTRETWALDVVSDKEHPARLGNAMTKAKKSAFTFGQLMELAKTKAVRFPKVMTCLNIGCPLGNGFWEGVPLREVVWAARPTENLRRVFYHGYHNDDPKQLFRSSLPVGRVFEDYFDSPPVILCYKLNGQWLTPERGAPVRVVVPEAYGFKSIKWLSRLVLSNKWAANDTYGEKNNDVDSPMKTFCDVLTSPIKATPGQPFGVTGYAQSGIAGLKKVQVWVQDANEDWFEDDPYFTRAPWRDAEILPPPKQWGGGLADNRIPPGVHGFGENGVPKQWPLRLTKAHWAVLLPGLPAGKYKLRCRTIDASGAAQPLPRPFRKSGRAHIAATRFIVQ